MPDKVKPTRPPLNKERILKAAVDLADREGLGALTMRRLGSELGVEAMSLYKHVANKDAILDGIVEYIVGEMEIPSEGTPWRDAMRSRASSARLVLRSHSWAIGLLESRGPSGPTVMSYLNATLGSLREGGFSIDDATHALWLLDSYIYGHVVQETSLRVEAADEPIETGGLQHLVELQQHASTADYSLDSEFEFGLGLILDGLEKLLKR